MTIEAGSRRELITVQRATVIADDYGGETPTYGDLGQWWARVRFGTGEERRTAAQEGADQAATFEILADPVSLTIVPTDQVTAFGDTWNITATNPTIDNRGVVLTALRRR